MSVKLHIRSALSSIRRAPFQALAAVSVLGVTFFVATVLAILVYSSNQVLNYFTTRPQVIAFLKDEASLEEIDVLRAKIQGDERVREVNFVSKEQALEIYKEATADNPLLAELVDPSIFPASLEFSVSDLEFADQVIEEVKQDEIVESVGFTASIGSEDSLGGVVERLKTVTKYIRLGGLVIMAVLGVTSFLVLMVVVGMRIASRRHEIEILGLIGATRAFISSPVLIESVVYGFLGAFFGWLAALILILYLTPSVLKYFGEIEVLPRDMGSLLGLLGVIMLGELVVAFFIAIIGGGLALSRTGSRRR